MLTVVANAVMIPLRSCEDGEQQARPHASRLDLRSAGGRPGAQQRSTIIRRIGEGHLCEHRTNTDPVAGSGVRGPEPKGAP